MLFRSRVILFLILQSFDLFLHLLSWLVIFARRWSVSKWECLYSLSHNSENISISSILIVFGKYISFLSTFDGVMPPVMDDTTWSNCDTTYWHVSDGWHDVIQLLGYFWDGSYVKYKPMLITTYKIFVHRLRFSFCVWLKSLFSAIPFSILSFMYSSLCLTESITALKSFFPLDVILILQDLN